MEIIEVFKELLKEVKVFRTNRIKDNQDARNNLAFNNKKLEILNNFKFRLQQLIRDNSENLKNVDVANEISTYNKAIESVIKEIHDILISRLNIPETMAEAFDLKVAGSLLPSMDGNEDTTKKLIDCIKLYSDMIKIEDQPRLINFVLKTRLSENAKIRLNSNYNSVDDLTRDLRANFVTQKSAVVLSNQLHQARQLDKSIDDFAQEIEQLLSNLTWAQAGNDATLLQSLRVVNENIAVNSFCNGIKNHDIRMIVKARNCSTLKDAISVAKDEERNKPSSSNVFHYDKRGGYNRANNNNRGFNRNCRRGFVDNANRGNRGFQNFQNYRPFQNQNFAHSGSFNYRNNNYSFPHSNRGQMQAQRRPYRGRGTNRGHSQQNQSAYYAENITSEENNSQSDERFFRE